MPRRSEGSAARGVMPRQQACRSADGRGSPKRHLPPRSLGCCDGRPAGGSAQLGASRHPGASARARAAACVGRRRRKRRRAAELGGSHRVRHLAAERQSARQVGGARLGRRRVVRRHEAVAVGAVASCGAVGAPRGSASAPRRHHRLGHGPRAPPAPRAAAPGAHAGAHACVVSANCQLRRCVTAHPGAVAAVAARGVDVGGQRRGCVARPLQLRASGCRKPYRASLAPSLT